VILGFRHEVDEDSVLLGC